MLDAEAGDADFDSVEVCAGKGREQVFVFFIGAGDAAEDEEQELWLRSQSKT